MMQCKDIPDRPILEFIRRVEAQEIEYSYENSGKVETFRPTSACVFIGTSYSVAQAMPGVTSEKLVRAKMTKLLKRGLVNGCPCGCRGDFTLTVQGRQFIDTNLPRHTTCTP